VSREGVTNEDVEGALLRELVKLRTWTGDLETHLSSQRTKCSAWVDRRTCFRGRKDLRAWRASNLTKRIRHGENRSDSSLERGEGRRTTYVCSSGTTREAKGRLDELVRIRRDPVMARAHVSAVRSTVLRNSKGEGTWLLTWSCSLQLE
jgi:hypothetical protein